MNPRPAGPVWRNAAFLLIPLFLGLCGLVAGRAVRPLWLGGSIDPSYPYLTNSLLVAELRQPAFVSHPGTPLQLVGAAVLRLHHLAAGSGPLRDAVLTAPDSYVEPIRVVLLLAIVLANAFQGWAAYRLTGSVALTGLVQLTPLLAPTLLLAHVQVLCEAPLLALSMAMAGLVLLFAAGVQGTTRWAVLAGVLAGVGTATKLTFASVAIVPLLLLSGRTRRTYVLGALGSFGVALLPIVGALPTLLDWVASLWLHAHDYGRGPKNVVDSSLYLANLVRLADQEPMGTGPIVVGIIAAAAGVFLFALVTRREPSPQRRALGAVLASVVVNWLVAAKSTAGFNYIVPTLGLSGALIALLVVVWQTQFERGPRLARVFTLVLLAAVPAQAVALGLYYFTSRRPVMPGALQAGETARRNGGESRVLLGSRASTVPAAMAYSNEWAGNAFSEDLRRLYPDAMSLDRLGFHVFGRPVEPADLERRLQGDALLLWDTTWEPLTASVWAAGARLETLGSFGRDRLHLAHLTPPDAEEARSSPFAGLLVLRGLPDLGIQFGVPAQDREALGPKMSAVFFGDGRAVRLHAEFRNEREGAQRLELSLNGEGLQAQDLAGRSEWTLVSQRLSSRQGLNEVGIAFDMTYGPLDEAHWFRVPGYTRDHPEGERTGVRFRRLQVLGEP
jgi:hypothetical protein